MAIERRRVFISVLMLAVLLFNVTATTLFIHSHDIEGTEIVHSHPYNPSNAHSHTRGHILILSNSLNHDAPVVETTASCEVFLTEVRILHEETISPAIEPTSLCFALRAPPAKA